MAFKKADFTVNQPNFKLQHKTDFNLVMLLEKLLNKITTILLFLCIIK